MISVVGKMCHIKLANLCMILIALLTSATCDILFENVPFGPENSTTAEISVSNQVSGESDEIAEENSAEKDPDSRETAGKRQCMSCASPSLTALYTDFYASFMRPPTTYTSNCNVEDIEDDEIQNMDAKSCSTPCISITDVIKAGGTVTRKEYRVFPKVSIDGFAIKNDFACQNYSRGGGLSTGRRPRSQHIVYLA